MNGCAACGDWSTGCVCRACAASLQVGPVFQTDGGVLVIAAYRHRAAARRLVHGLKYAGLPRALEHLAGAMADRLPPDTEALVPVTRARVRKWRYGVDPSTELARRIAVLGGVPVRRVLRPAVWWPRHAARGERPRSTARFTATAVGGAHWVLVDDVATSGATLDAAAAALGQRHLRALVATAPSRVMTTLANTDHPDDARDRGRRGPVDRRASRRALGHEAPSARFDDRNKRLLHPIHPGR